MFVFCCDEDSSKQNWTVSREVINDPYKALTSLSVIKTNQGKNNYLHIII